MNTPRTFLLALISAGIACAQNTPAPAPAAAPQSGGEGVLASSRR